MNAVVRSVLFDLSIQRKHPADPSEPVFACTYVEADNFFPKAVERARQALKKIEKDATRLEGYTWHGNRHSFASRLVMAGVDLLTVQKLGGWRTLSVVQRYAHLAPDHLRSAVERLVARTDVSELAHNLPVRPSPMQQVESGALEICDPKGTEG